MELLRPANLQAALRMMANGRRVTPFAGGTDLMVSWHHALKDDLVLMDLSGVRELRAYQLGDDFLELGALTTYWDIIAFQPIANEFPLLIQAAKQVGAIQIQTRGTWAGNIGNASPAADGVPVLMAYDALVVLQSIDGPTEVPVHQYYTGYKQTVRKPNQLITAIRIPRRPRPLQWFHKVGARSAQTITKVGAAVVHDAKGWRVVANSVAPYVCRCHLFEQAMQDAQSFNSPRDVLDVIRRDIAPISDIRSTAEYRSAVLSRLLYWRLIRGITD